jgi:hypothetical protein
VSGQLSVTPETGVIATLVRGEQVASIHVTGTPTVALGKVVRLCDRYGWKIRCLSSPATIFRDLGGSRAATSPQRGDMYIDHGEPPQTRVAVPEPLMLTKLGRQDLLYGR